MRYPFRTVDGTPAVQPISIGVQMMPVPVPVPPPASECPPINQPNAYWAFYPHTRAPDDTALTIVGKPSNGIAETTPAGAVVGEFGYYANKYWMTVAIVKNAPNSAVITWAISTPVIAIGSNMSVDNNLSPNGIGFSIRLFQFDRFFYLYEIAVTDSKVLAYFGEDFNSGSGYPAWALAPITLTASVNGVALRTLTLTVSSNENGGR